MEFGLYSEIKLCKCLPSLFFGLSLNTSTSKLSNFCRSTSGISKDSGNERIIFSSFQYCFGGQLETHKVSYFVKKKRLEEDYQFHFVFQSLDIDLRG